MAIPFVAISFPLSVSIHGLQIAARVLSFEAMDSILQLGCVLIGFFVGLFRGLIPALCPRFPGGNGRNSCRHQTRTVQRPLDEPFRLPQSAGLDIKPSHTA